MTSLFDSALNYNLNYKEMSAADAALRLLLFRFLFQVLFQDEIDVLGQGTAVIVGLFPDLLQDITVNRDTDLLF